MNTYELVIVLDGKASPAKRKAFETKLEKIIKLSEGKILETENWGVKDLAYPIKNSLTGLFLIFTLELKGEGAKAIPVKLKLEEEVKRYLLLRK